jgi:phosphocarrier protein
MHLGIELGLRRGEQRVRPTAVTRDVVIRNRLGLHARAAAQFVKTAGRFRAEITVAVDRHKVNGKSIMGLLMLAASQGTTLTLRAQGEDGSAALQALAELVEGRFGERE